MSDKADNSENVLASTSGQDMVPCHKNWSLSIHLKLFRTTTKLAHSALFLSLPRCYLPLCDARVLPPSDAFLCWREHWVNGGKYFDAQYPIQRLRVWCNQILALGEWLPSVRASSWPGGAQDGNGRTFLVHKSFTLFKYLLLNCC